LRIKPPPGCDSIIITNRVNVRYLTGFTGSSGCVLVTPRLNLFFTDFRYEQQASRQVKDFSVRIIRGVPCIEAAVYAESRRMKLGVLGFEGASLSQNMYRKLRRSLKGVKFKDVSGTVERLREIKSRGEVAAIRKAAAIADAALKRLGRTRVTGKSEKEIAWLLERWMREAGSEALPFDIIVASGRRSAMPHGIATDKVIKPNELVVVDLGARVGGYCSDITRTFATGNLTRRQQDIYTVVREAQERALEAVKPGVVSAAVDDIARSYIRQAGYGGLFGHALGHGVGLEAHEAPVLAARSTEELAAGMVVTIEPGIYHQRVGGVRIEDTVLVSVLGAEPLTKYPRVMKSLK
jgi:Xaa-Pro aminopeptidase